MIKNVIFLNPEKTSIKVFREDGVIVKDWVRDDPELIDWPEVLIEQASVDFQKKETELAERWERFQQNEWKYIHNFEKEVQKVAGRWIKAAEADADKRAERAEEEARKWVRQAEMTAEERAKLAEEKISEAWKTADERATSAEEDAKKWVYKAETEAWKSAEERAKQAEMSADERAISAEEDAKKWIAQAEQRAENEIKASSLNFQRLEAEARANIQQQQEEVEKSKEQIDDEIKQSISEHFAREIALRPAAFLNLGLEHDQLFEIKLAAFDLPAVKENKDRKLKTRLRKSKDFYEIMHCIHLLTGGEA